MRTLNLSIGLNAAVKVRKHSDKTPAAKLMCSCLIDYRFEEYVFWRILSAKYGRDQGRSLGGEAAAASLRSENIKECVFEVCRRVSWQSNP